MTAQQGPSVAIHVGAHKTATTHLQHALLTARQAVARAGVQVYGPPHLRQPETSLAARFALPIHQKPAPGGIDRAAALADMVRSGHRLVITEENFLGTLQNARGEVALPLYRQARRRLALLAGAVAPARGLEVFLAVRQPATFLNSAYGQLVMSGRITPPDIFRDMTPPSSVDWADLAARIVAAPGVARLTIWRYEDYAAVFPRVVAALLGPAVAPLVTPPEDRIHRGLSAAAVQQLLAAQRAGDTLSPAEARAAYPVSAAHPSFDAFDAADHAAAATAYDAQVAAIAALPRVRLLSPLTAAEG